MYGAENTLPTRASLIWSGSPGFVLLLSISSRWCKCLFSKMYVAYFLRCFIHRPPYLCICLPRNVSLRPAVPLLSRSNFVDESNLTMGDLRECIIWVTYFWQFRARGGIFGFEFCPEVKRKHCSSVRNEKWGFVAPFACIGALFARLERLAGLGPTWCKQNVKSLSGECNAGTFSCSRLCVFIFVMFQA